MKKLTKVVSFIVAMVVVLGTLPMMSVSAETTTAAGTIGEFQWESQGTLSYSTDHAYNGARSLKIQTDGSNTFVLPASQYFKYGTYDFEFYIYPKTVSGTIETRMSWGNSAVPICQGGSMKTGDVSKDTSVPTTVEAVSNPSVGDGTWYKVTGENYVGANESTCGLISFHTSSGEIEVYIDGLKITRQDGVLVNDPSGDFEGEFDGTTFPTQVAGLGVKVEDANDFKAGEYEVSVKSDKAYNGESSLFVTNWGKRHDGTEKDLSNIWLTADKAEDWGVTVGDGSKYSMEYYIYPVRWLKFSTNNELWSGEQQWIGPKLTNVWGEKGTLFINDSWELSPWHYAANWVPTKITSGPKAGWYQIKSTGFSFAETYNNVFEILAYGEFYLDDITIYKVESDGEKLLKKYDFEFVLGNFETSKSGNDTTVSIDIQNISDASKTTAQLMVAAYDGDDMVEFASSALTDISVAAAKDGITLSKTITVPEGATLKAFLWDSINGMKAIKIGDVSSL